MAKRSFEDWMGDVRELARDEFGVEFDEMDCTEEDAYEAFKLGLKPKAFLKNMGAEQEEDLTEIMREL